MRFFYDDEFRMRFILMKETVIDKYFSYFIHKDFPTLFHTQEFSGSAKTELVGESGVRRKNNRSMIIFGEL